MFQVIGQANKKMKHAVAERKLRKDQEWTLQQLDSHIRNRK